MDETWENMNIDDLVKAIEDDEGESIPGLREALINARSGRIARVTVFYGDNKKVRFDLAPSCTKPDETHND